MDTSLFIERSCKTIVGFALFQGYLIPEWEDMDKAEEEGEYMFWRSGSSSEGFLVSRQRFCYDTRRELSILEQTIPKTVERLDLQTTERRRIEQHSRERNSGVVNDRNWK